MGERARRLRAAAPRHAPRARRDDCANSNEIRLTHVTREGFRAPLSLAHSCRPLVHLLAPRISQRLVSRSAMLRVALTVACIRRATCQYPWPPTAFRIMPAIDTIITSSSWSVQEVEIYPNSNCGGMPLTATSAIASFAPDAHAIIDGLPAYDGCSGHRCAGGDPLSWSSGRSGFMAARSEWVGFIVQSPAFARCARIKQNGVSRLVLQSRLNTNSPWIDVMTFDAVDNFGTGWTQVTITSPPSPPAPPAPPSPPPPSLPPPSR